MFNAPGLFFFALVAGPSLVLILNRLSLKARSGRVSSPCTRLDWGDECLEVSFIWPPATERPLAKTDAHSESTAMSGVERKPPRSVAGGTT